MIVDGPCSLKWRFKIDQSSEFKKRSRYNGFQSFDARWGLTMRGNKRNVFIGYLMPSRPRSHIIGDRAISDICQLCSECGWAVEPVVNDYGEDLHIQTSFRDKVDPCRMWMQVKGTERIGKHSQKDGSFSYSLPTDQVLKWIRHIEPVIFVLWDVESRRGWWGAIGASFRDVDLVLHDKKSIRIKLQERNQVTIESLRQLEWDNRINHFSNLITLYSAREETAARRLDPEKASLESLPMRVSSLATLDFMRHMDFFKGRSYELQDTIHTKFQNAFKNVARGDSMATKRENRVRALILVILGHMNTLSKYAGMQEILLHSVLNWLDQIIPTSDTDSESNKTHENHQITA